jgi:uncharacterized protein YndB with AHSA1/START domain
VAVEASLARFVDRHTLVYERHYPHAIELVWDAVSMGEHLDVWLLPESRVERRLGGACAFGWGSSADDPAASVGTVTVFDPPRAIQYTFDDGEKFMRFDLAPEGDGTRLSFVHHFGASQGNEPEDYPGGDLPAGPDTAWRPGFVAGFHEFLDDLAGYLTGQFTALDRTAMVEGRTDPSDHERMIEVYRAHIREHCPPG